ncbi:MAG: hypothetical protein MJY99_09295 [Fibrobacter sp.]|nr:hypothetical protein [Fibrobacter sp.]
MRTALFCSLFFVALAWSDVNLIWTQFQFEKGYLEVDTAKICNVDTTYINCTQNKGLAYYSTLDTGYAVLFNPLITKAQIFKYLNENEQSDAAAGKSVQITAVLRYEFMKWQEWGIIKMTKDSAQRLLDRILPESRDIQGRTIIHKKVCDEESPSSCQGELLWGGSGSPGLTEEDAARLPQKKFLAESAEPASVDTSAKIPVGEQPGDTTLSDSLGNPLRFTKSAPLAGSVTQGMHYRVFDMNGVFLYESRWQGNLKAPGKPVIVRFGNGLTKVFR